MSHFTKAESQIKDINVLQQACQDMNLTITANEKARGYRGNSLKGDFVIKLKGPYDIALQLENDGTYSLHTDWFGGSVAKQVGKNFGLLKQAYGIAAVRMEAESRGMMLEEEKMKDGTVRFHIREKVYNRA